jgi:hypothetical protein
VDSLFKQTRRVSLYCTAMRGGLTGEFGLNLGFDVDVYCHMAFLQFMPSNGISVSGILPSFVLASNLSLELSRRIALNDLLAHKAPPMIVARSYALAKHHGLVPR